MKKTSLILGLLALLLWSSSALAAADTAPETCIPTAPPASLDVRPNLVSIGTSYNGTTLTLTGEIPAGSEAVVRLLGDRGEKHFKEKGRALGVLWMNLATVSLHDVPGVFLLAVDADTYAGGDAAWKKLGLGFESVQGETDEIVFDEFLKLKSGEGLYRIEEGVTSYEQGQDGLRHFTAKLEVPSSLHKGIYQVQLFAVRDGRVVARAAREMHAELSGFPALLSSIAYGHGLLYGVAATLIAIMAGLFMTVLFRDRGAAH